MQSILYKNSTFPFFQDYYICFTLRGMSPLHLLGAYGKDNSSLILDLFKEYINNFDLSNILSLGRVIT